MQNLRYCILFLCFSLFTIKAWGQNKTDAEMIATFHEKAVVESKAYEWLEFLCKKIGNRLSGTPQLMAATYYSKSLMEQLNFDSVWLQPCQVPVWIRGEKEECRIVSSKLGSFELKVLALGNSTGTGQLGVEGEVIIVNSLQELEKMDDSKVKDKIVFFNRPFQESALYTGKAYGSTVDQRVRGPQLAAKKGAVAALVRSVTANRDDEPHTGATNFEDGARQIPCYALGTQSSNLLADLNFKSPVRVYCKSTSKMMGTTDGYNVIGQLTGSKYPDEVIIIGGHLDSWDIGEGAHDDGTGCVQSIEVLRLLQSSGYKPQRTIRAILYTNEENGLAGGKAYKAYADVAKEKQMMAIESDSGGHSPQGFFYEAEAGISPEFQQSLKEWKVLLEPYGYQFVPGGSGADVGTLRPLKTFLLGLMPDSQRYFDYHHSSNDTFDKVNRRELELGAAAVASIVFLADKYGLK